MNDEHPVPNPPARRRSRLFGWWYLSIGAGFALLGVHRLVIGESAVLVALRWLIAAGFFLLGWLEFRSRRAGR